MLTLKELEGMPSGNVFAQGTVEDSLKGINIANTGTKLKWVAVRGGIHDWAIYTDNPYSPLDSFEKVVKFGNKVISAVNIRMLVPCDDEAFKVYRY